MLLALIKFRPISHALIKEDWCRRGAHQGSGLLCARIEKEGEHDKMREVGKERQRKEKRRTRPAISSLIFLINISLSSGPSRFPERLAIVLSRSKPSLRAQMKNTLSIFIGRCRFRCRGHLRTEVSKREFCRQACLSET